jgi:hypothetical protein
MFPGSDSCLVDAPGVSNGWEQGIKQGEVSSASQLGSPGCFSLAQPIPLHPLGPAVICYQAEPEEIDGDTANISALEGSPFANMSSKEAGLIHY